MSVSEERTPMLSNQPYWQELSETFLASIRSVGTACTLAAVGIYMHQRGLISVQGKRMLATLSQQVTVPLFLFTKIIECNQDWSTESCPSVTQTLKQAWILLIWPLFVVMAGFLVGRVVAFFCQTPRSQHKSVMVAVGFANSTGLPITLLTVVHENFGKTSDLGRVDPTLFLSVYLILYPILMWGLGGWLLAPSKDEQEAQEAQDEDVERKKSHISDPKDEDTISTRSLTDPKTELSPLLAATDTDVLFLQQRNPYLPSIQSSLNVNVLNNKADDQQYLLRHKGLYSTDEGIYLSDFNLSAMASQSQADLSQQFALYSSTAANPGDQLSAAVNSFPPRKAVLPPLASSSRLLPPGSLAASSLTPTPAPDSLTYESSSPAPISRTSSSAEFLIYDAPDSMQVPSDVSPLLLGARDGGCSTELSSLDQGIEEQQIGLSLVSSMTQPLQTIFEKSSQQDHKTKSYGVTIAPETGKSEWSLSLPQLPQQSEKVPPSQENGVDNSKSHKSKFAGDSILATFQTVMDRCFQPPVIGAVAGILVSISPLRGLFVDVADRDGDAPLEWMFDGLFSVGKTAVPINMIILGCNLSNSYDKYHRLRKSSATLKPNVSLSLHNDEGSLSRTTLIGVVLGKMIVMPIIGFLSTWFLQEFVLNIPSDIAASFYLVMVIVFLTPTANNVMVMVELSGSNVKEGIANVIAMQYIVAPIILSCTMTMAVSYATSKSADHVADLTF